MMVPLLISSLIALTVSSNGGKPITSDTRPPRVYNGVLEKAQAGKVADAIQACQGKTIPAAAVLKAGLEHFKSPMEEMEIAMKNAGEFWVPRLEKYIHILDTTVTIAPLMGLLGTIIGMMGSFTSHPKRGGRPLFHYRRDRRGPDRHRYRAGHRSHMRHRPQLLPDTH